MLQRFRLAAAVLVVACRPFAGPIWTAPNAEARVTCDERANAERRWVEFAEACEIAGVQVPAGSRVQDDGEGRWQLHAPQVLVIDGVPCDAWSEISLAGRQLTGCRLHRGSRGADVRLHCGFAVELHASGALREGWLVGVRRFDSVVVRGRVQLTADGRLEEGELACRRGSARPSSRSTGPAADASSGETDATTGPTGEPGLYGPCLLDMVRIHQETGKLRQIHGLEDPTSQYDHGPA